MTEQLHHKKQPETSEQIANTPLEIVDDVLIVENQFIASLEQLAVSEIDDITSELNDSADQQTLKEKYALNYEPLKVVVGMADIAMLASSPELLKEQVEQAAVEEMEEGNIDRMAA